MTLDLAWYQAQSNTNVAATNGGRLSHKKMNAQAGFSGVSPAEVASGLVRWRKEFLKIDDATNPTVSKAIIFLKSPTTATGTRAVMRAGTQTDVQSGIGTRNYATGVLNANVSIGATTLIVDFEPGSAADLVAQIGDTLYIGDGIDEEYNLEINNIVWTDEQATITLVSGTLAAYSAGAYVGSCIEDTVNVNTLVDGIVKTFTTSTFDEVTYPIALENKATIEQTITLTFTSATAFSAVSDVLGTLANGSVNSDYEPINTNFSLPYFSVPSLAWGGTHTVGETLEFSTHPSAVSIWLKHEVYAGAAVEANTFDLGVRVQY